MASIKKQIRVLAAVVRKLQTRYRVLKRRVRTLRNRIRIGSQPAAQFETTANHLDTTGQAGLMASDQINSMLAINRSYNEAFKRAVERVTADASLSEEIERYRDLIVRQERALEIDAEKLSSARSGNPSTSRGSSPIVFDSSPVEQLCGSPAAFDFSAISSIHSGNPSTSSRSSPFVFDSSLVEWRAVLINEDRVLVISICRLSIRASYKY